MVIAISTPAGEGKTTTTVGLADGLRHIGKKSMVALREPSLGPIFGVKGSCRRRLCSGCSNGRILTHFTGDMHAIGAANNLLAAMIDNHIYQGNKLGIDPRRLTWRRCVDMNDRRFALL